MYKLYKAGGYYLRGVRSMEQRKKKTNLSVLLLCVVMIQSAMPQLLQATPKKFNHAVEFMLAYEGGYSNDFDDDGGETKFGISKRTYPHIEISTLTEHQAREIYRRDFWESKFYKDIKNIHISAKVFDMAVNMGSSVACRLVRRALRATGFAVEESDSCDMTITKMLNQSKSPDILAALKSEAAGYYRMLGMANTKNEKFVKGWVKRAYSCPRTFKGKRKKL